MISQVIFAGSTSSFEGLAEYFQFLQTFQSYTEDKFCELPIECALLLVSKLLVLDLNCMHVEVQVIVSVAPNLCSRSILTFSLCPSLLELFFDNFPRTGHLLAAKDL